MLAIIGALYVDQGIEAAREFVWVAEGTFTNVAAVQDQVVDLGDGTELRPDSSGTLVHRSKGSVLN